jgi:Ni/Co efflux regulator RcnB
MKRLLTAGAALLVLGSAAAATAQPRHAPPGRHMQQQQHWRQGQRLPPQYRGAYVSNWKQHRLRQPPRGYRWVRHNDQFLLTAVATGLIASAIAAR